MFLQVCVCPRGGGCLPQCMLGCHTPPGMENPPGMEEPPLDGEPPQDGGTPREWRTPPGSRLQHTVYKRPVRILLECILVFLHVSVILFGGGGVFPACITGHMTNQHYISRCTGVDSQLVLGQHTDNIKCIMG